MYSILSDINIEAELERYKLIREIIKPCVKDTTLFLYNLLQLSNKFVIVEGANAAMLDISFGTYPYVTASISTIGGVCRYIYNIYIYSIK